MNYTAIINLIVTCISVVMTISTLHFVFFAIVGAFKRKTFPKTDQKLKYGIVIAARNEEKVVGNLIESIRKNDYPQDKLQIFVIAHNCSDNTAAVARQYGATVYEYNNENEKTKGYAMKYLFDAIRRDYNIEDFAGFFMFDADNLLATDYISKMNDAFVACERKCIITSFRNSKNFGTNVMSGLYGMFFAAGCRLEARGRTVCNCATRVQGTGYLFGSDVVKDGWNYVTLTEDWEFTADRIMEGNKIKICDEAVCFDEQPTQVKVMLRQRLRWAKGYLLVCITRYKRLLKNLFGKNKDKDKPVYRGSILDFIINITPFNIVSIFLSILQIILLAFSPLFGVDALSVWKNFLLSNASALVIGYIGMVLYGALIYLLEHKRIKNVSLSKKILSCLCWPIFNFLTPYIAFVAMCSKNVGWKTIPHVDTTNHDEINTEKQQALRDKFEELKEKTESQDEQTA